MISVLMSVYNEKIDWLKKAVESILSQTFEEYEFIIIVDNPALDEAAKDYLKHISDNYSRVRLHYNEKNIGLMNSLNKGLEIAQGEYIARMDADDISFPERLEKELKYLLSNSYDMVSANKINIDEEGRIINKDKHRYNDPMKHLPYTNFIVHPLVLIRTDVIKKLGGYRAFHNSEDYDLWLRVLSAGYSIGILDEYLLYYRIRSSSMSSNNQLETYYITRYQQKLYRERIKKKSDSFSRNSLLRYLESKRISENKVKRYIRYRSLFDEAIKLFKVNDNHYISYIIKASVTFPSIAIQDCFRLVHLIR